MERHVEDMLRPIAPVYTNNISQKRGVGSWKNKTIILKNWLEERMDKGRGRVIEVEIE